MEKIFYNGIILTMESEPLAEAVLIRGSLIAKTGSLTSLQAESPDAELIDLEGRTMLPAFIDAHGHFSSYANAQLQVSLDGAASFSEITERIRAFILANRIPAGDWVIASGYDHNMLAERCHPGRELLDLAAPDNPLLLQHQSHHCGVLNTRALALLDITPDTKAPSGGVIGVNAEGGLTGYLEETAYIQHMQKLPPADYEALLTAFRKAMNLYFSYGITTIQEGMMMKQMIPLYQLLLNRKLLSIDVVGYPDLNSMREFAETFPDSFGKYHRHFKIGGYKIILDGSPQMKTAWMKTPYQGDDTYCGYGTMSDGDVAAAVERAADEKLQILAHCNGDAAVQQYIDAVKKAAAKNLPITDLKPVIIHAQLMTTEQLKEAAVLHMIPSFFVAHVLHWGDIHIENFGFDRAQSISPARSALENTVIFTFHQDTPVIKPDMLETIQCAVTRKTKSGVTLGEEECISVLDALKAVTIHAAFQYSEEDRKGSIREGKQADFVILSHNPLTVAKEQIKEIQVLETIKDGETVFHA